MEKPTETNRRSAIRMTSFTTREEPREDGASDPVIEGYFAVFGDVYELWPGASETIQRGAFSGVVGGDVRALINHDTTLVLGRTRAGTLTLYEDERGLFGRIRINPDDSDAMSLYARVKRGDVDQCSFGFDIGKERTEFSEDGSSIRWTIEEVSQLYEVSVCTFPAYEATGVSARRADYDTIQKRKAQAWREGARSKLKKEEK